MRADLGPLVERILVAAVQVFVRAIAIQVVIRIHTVLTLLQIIAPLAEGSCLVLAQIVWLELTRTQLEQINAEAVEIQLS